MSLHKSVLSSRTARTISLVLPLFLLVALAVSFRATPGANAQEPETDSLAKVQKDTAELTETLADVGEMAVVNPLKLTPDQLQKVTNIVSVAQNSYNKKLADLSAPSVAKVLPDARAAKKLALAGNPVPAELDARIKEGMNTYLKAAKKKEALDNQTLKSLSEQLQAVLSERQVAAAAKIAKENQEKLSEKPAQGTNAQWFNYYIQKVVMGYPRLVPLLKEMQNARKAGGDSDGTQ